MSLQPTCYPYDCSTVTEDGKLFAGSSRHGNGRTRLNCLSTRNELMSEREYHGIRAKSRIDALSIAAANCMLKEMRLLVDDGADIDGIASYDKSTALATAAGYGLIRSVNFLLDNGANVDLPGANDMTPLMRACAAGGNKGSRVALRLIEAKADVKYIRKGDEMTALKFAVKNCTPEVIQALIASGADIDGPRGTDQTALMLAARSNNVLALRVLVENGADVSLRCKLRWAENRTAQGLAELENRKKAAAYLASIGRQHGRSSKARTRTKQTPTVKASWKRIEKWLRENAPSQAKSLGKGATSAQVNRLESRLGVSLPAQFIESYSHHDGQKGDCDFIPDGYGTFYLLTLRDIPREWRLWNELTDSGEFDHQEATPDEGVAEDWWNRGWIPFASNGGGDHLCIDLAPAKGGKVGQVIKMQHDDSDRKLLAPSFAAWLNHLAEALKNGELDLFLE
jgi:cell wall assembly regulator SMI1